TKRSLQPREEEEEQESSSKSSSSINSNEQDHENIEKTNVSVNDRSSSNSKLLKRTFCLTEKRSNVYQPTSKRYRIDTSFVRRKTEASSQSESKVIRRKSNLQRNEEKDSYDLFFQSMSVVTKNLPPKLAIEAKSKVMSIMAEIELRAINEREVLEDKDK
uniref:BESS domain-containing protein n=1 Tax=Glossina brevipalpis TaxID=37001 RepID=A0A1A9WMH9_9MUSC